eukprot:CAMPEP_0172568894 /NCGR_PEP_ID=MMETSP1067-20121228/121452_1 /TAXON_ID=265564 ORGANISM="Thalassiosira punctigera, Strain Tpunct2005C2" /NCGR_SAMPLE_ID=MMETSP1067 /ASSEMBLY_ACC=CAM_ASM_000444 /LENGTH=1033 /DNA_ID=CAMNT_0013360607 /DNA_START=182 /DNA_END=3283 /DNA_ORIENTATION=+
MARRGGKNKGNNGGGGGKKWSRKRKAEERSAKTGKERNNNNGGGYSTTQSSNAKFEAYYSLVGLHNTRYDEESEKFVPCASDEEKHAERDRFMTACTGILPASFRVDRSLDEETQKNVLEELRKFVGKEMEVEIELPRRTPAFGGMKNILEKGANGDAGGEEKADNVKQDKKDEEEQDGGEKMAKSGDQKADGVKDEAKQNGCAVDSSDATTNNEEAASITNGDNGPTLVKRTIAPAKPIPFICSNSTVLGFQLSFDRRTLRRNKSLEPLHNWMKIQSDCGHITRQETVSMIPPVVLDVKEGMSVLDMCAAPGSKTCQLLENVAGFGTSSAAGEGGSKDGSGELEPTGYVVANDADPKRAYMLVHQLRRMNSPSVFVTSCDGQYFPILDQKADKGTVREGTFDRVLCDVPCSGDGTVRKNPGIWRHWNQLGSLALHPLQLSIALRGARLTKVGGYMVYSTCSMNPMENESVVAELLRVGEGALALEDPRGRMEGLVARPGWASWKVLRESKYRTRKKMKDWRKKNNSKMLARKKEWEEKRRKEMTEGHYGPAVNEEKADEKKDDDGKKEEEEEEKFVPSPFDTIPYIPPATWDDAALSERTTSLGFAEYSSYDEVEQEWRRRVRLSCFPPTEEEAKKFELEKCLRCLPQDMDTGGFFVALLKKVKPLSKNATQRMEALAKESRGGGEVDAHVNKKAANNGENNTKSPNGEEESEDATMIESSAAEDKPDSKEPTDANVSDDKGDSKPTEETKEEEEEEPVQKAPQGKVGMYHQHQKKNDLSKEDFMAVDPSIWPPIVEEFGLAPSFPKEQFMVRASGGAKILYFISKSIKDLIDFGIQDRVTVINSGLKGFERCSLKEQSDMSYRLAQEGIQYIVPHMTKRILSANVDDFHACVKLGFIPFDAFSEEFQKGLEELTPGSFIVALEGYEKDVAKKMYLTMWRRTNRVVNCFVTKIEMEAVLSKMRALGHVAKEEEKDGNTANCEEKKSVGDSAEKELAGDSSEKKSVGDSAEKELDGDSAETKSAVEDKMDTSS